MNTDLAYDELVVAADTPFPLDRYLEIERAGARSFETGLRLCHCPWFIGDMITSHDEPPVSAIRVWSTGWNNAWDDASIARKRVKP